jgi:hypothetical protein
MMPVFPGFLAGPEKRQWMFIWLLGLVVRLTRRPLRLMVQISTSRPGRVQLAILPLPLMVAMLVLSIWYVALEPRPDTLRERVGLVVLLPLLLVLAARPPVRREPMAMAAALL